MTRPRFERILAGDIKPGMRVAPTRNATPTLVTRVHHHPVAVTLEFEGRYGTGRLRPRKTTKWWRLDEPEGTA